MKKFTIGKVAKAAGVSVETIRFYERKELIRQPPAIDGSYRYYPDETVARVCFIQRAKQLGFNLDEVRELLSLVDRPSDDRKGKYNFAHHYLISVNQKIDRLLRMQTTLTDFMEQCRTQKSSVTCSIIDCLADDAEK